MMPGLTRKGLSNGLVFDGPLSCAMDDDTKLEIQHDGDEIDDVMPIAIIGFSLRFPQDATSTDSFWSMLVEGRCAMTEFPKDRININAFYHPDANRTDTLPFRGGHFLAEDISAFDAPFFSIKPAEAAGMDPQQRGLLETAYRALENAGIPLRRAIGSRTSVHTGCFASDYAAIHIKDPQLPAKYAATGVAQTLLANRLSWFFDLTGPSVNLDSACSSSMMALDLACQGLRNGDSTMGLVAGCNLIYDLQTMSSLTNMNFLSHDSRCHSFDHRANGYGRGEGFGVIVIKPLSNAVCDGDTIRAVIRSTGSNQDGRTPGITQPSKIAQERLIRETYAKAGLSLKDTSYVEAHGTGTPIGDPIEAGAIGTVFREHREDNQPLYVGSVKSNIGHLEGASGVAGIIKTVLILERGVIPPIADFERLNTNIDSNFLRIKFPQECTPWPNDGLRRASVNSFGLGGANSHAVLDDAYNFLHLRNLKGHHCTVQQPPSRIELDGSLVAQRSVIRTNSQTLGNKPESVSRPKLLVWSAADEGGVKRLCDTYSKHFTDLSLSYKEVSSYLGSLAYTLAMRRTPLLWKTFMVADSFTSLEELGAKVSKATRSTIEPKLGFIFTGQGAQWYGMGRELLSFPAFKDSLHNAQEYLQGLGCQWSLLDELLKDDATSRVNEPAYSQPLCTALQVALVDLLRSFNIYPEAVVGHSSGEIAAAYSMSAISNRSAWKIAYYRGSLASTLAQTSQYHGAMVSVGLSESRVQAYLDNVASKFQKNGLSIGCINSSENTTVTGVKAQIDALTSLLNKDSIFARKLQVNVAYHSAQMNEIAFQYLLLIKDVEAGEALSKTPAMISSLTGNRVLADEVRRAEYWVKNMTSPVRFSEALTHICSRVASCDEEAIVVNNLLELGPHSALRGPVREILNGAGMGIEIGYDSMLVRNKSALDSTLEVIGRLYCAGFPINIEKVNQSGFKPADHSLVLANLPEYPFDHSQTYWHESRLSNSYRLRKNPRLDLLGTPVPDWNQSEARWRNIIRVSELPWIEDHKVNGSVLYPAAGMLVMAIEAARQVADVKRQITGFILRDVVFQTSLSLPLDEEGTETQFFLRHIKRAADKDTTSWSEFRLYSLLNGGWVENCHGFLQVQYEERETEVDGGKEAREKQRHYSRVYESRRTACFRAVDTRRMYQRMQDCGLNYGLTFQRLQAMSCNDKGEATAKLDLFKWTASRDANHPQSHVIHPTSLDGVFQLTFTALSKGGIADMPTMVPTRIQNLWVSNLGLSHTYADSIKLYAESKLGGHLKEAYVFGLDDKEQDLRILIEGLETTVVAGSDAASPAQPHEKRLCYSIDWKPDVDHLDYDQALKYCQSVGPASQEPIQFFQDLRFLMLTYISRALDIIRDHPPKELKPHLEKYVAWMRLQVARFSSGDLPCSQPQWKTVMQDDEYQDKLRHQVMKNSKQGKFYVEVGRNLLEILYGKLDPLDLMFKGDLAKEYYQDISNSVNYRVPLARYLDCLAHKNPGMKVLEVGAGTGGMTSHVLSTLILHGEDEAGTPRYARYDYTDISPSFFQAAEEMFNEHVKRMRFKTLNIEDDPVAQGFEERTYDLVIAASVLHATKDLGVTIQNIRRLLKPRGKLILLEVTKPDKLGAGFAFGLLPGWWLSTDDDRQWSPCVSEGKWSEICSLNGFSEVELVLHDYQDEWCQETSVMVFSAVDKLNEHTSGPKTIILVEESSPNQQHVARQLQRQLKSTGTPNSCILFLQDTVKVDDLSQSCAISLLELENTMLHNLNARSFTTLQALLTSVQKLLWVTQPHEDEETPSLGMVDGLARVLRSENAKLAFVTLALQNIGSATEQTVQSIIQAFQATHSGLAEDCYERELVERDGVIHISRIVEAHYLNRHVSSQTVPNHPKLLEFEKAPPLTLSVKSPGLLDTLQFIEDPCFNTPLAPNEIEVEVKAVGLNFMDLLVALGRLNKDYMGTECAGIVTRVGAKASFKVGDRVTMGCVNTFKTYARCPYQCAAKIPDALSFPEAAALPTTFTTAYHSLHEVAGMQEGESVLIHSAAGGTGQAAIQVAKYLGAEVFVTVGSNEKKDLIMTLYNIPEDHIFYSRNTSFAQGIKRMTKGQGVDVVLNSLAGEGLVASWECIAPFGRFIEIGKRDILSHGQLPMFPFAENVSFSAVDMATMGRARPAHVEKILGDIMALVADNKLHAATPLRVYGVAEIEQAFRHMQSGKNVGKIVVEMNKHDQVLTCLDPGPSYRFDEHATYLISGGLGGLGRSISRWMVSRGARNLILLSRSGPQTKEAAAFKEELQTKGVCVKTPSCDVVNAASLESVLMGYMQTMPPIKGCIQAAVALKDAIFQKMSFEDWKVCLEPKVQGSWNLHKLLPKGMDFFILLSSLCGIVGKESQANYAAANSYMDALAHYRTGIGEKAASIDLGIMEEEGILAENADLMAKMKAPGTLIPVLSKELHALLDHFCNPALGVLSPLKCHTVIGIETPANLHAKGLEPSNWMHQPICRHFFQIDGTDSTATASETATDLPTLFASAGSLVAAGALVTEALMEKLSKSVSIAKEDMDVDKPMYLYGVDSLMAVELRNWFAKKLNADVAVFDIVGDTTFAKVGLLAAERSSYRSTAWAES